MEFSCKMNPHQYSDSWDKQEPLESGGEIIIHKHLIHVEYFIGEFKLTLFFLVVYLKFSTVVDI